MTTERISHEEAIARYDRYLQEFVEALNVCPFARRAREDGRLRRAVSDIERDDVDAAVQALKDVTNADLDVAVVIFPYLQMEWGPFNRFVGKVRDVFTKASNPPNGYFLVTMHPDSPMDLTDPDRAVAFMRRTPHPSIQVSRVPVIYEARKTSNPDENVSDRVARLGLEAVKKAGPEKVQQLLEDIRKGRR